MRSRKRIIAGRGVAENGYIRVLHCSRIGEIRRSTRKLTDPSFILLVLIVFLIWLYRATENFSLYDSEKGSRIEAEKFVVHANKKTYKISDAYHKLLSGRTNDSENLRQLLLEAYNTFMGINLFFDSVNLVSLLRLTSIALPGLIVLDIVQGRLQRLILKYVCVYFLGVVTVVVPGTAVYFTQKIIEKYSDAWLVFSSLYLLSFICHYSRMIIAETYVMYQVTPDKTEFPIRAVHSVVEIARYHIGSIAFAATLILPICTTIMYYSRVIYRVIRRASGSHGYTVILLSIMNLSDYLVIVTSITRENVIPVLGRVFDIINYRNRKQFLKIVVVQSVCFFSFTLPQALTLYLKYKENNATQNMPESALKDIVYILLGCYTSKNALEVHVYVNLFCSVLQSKLIFENSRDVA